MTAAVEAGADLLGFVLAPESPRAAERVLPVPGETLSVAVWVGAAGDSPADLDQVHSVEEGKVRGREATLYRDGEPVARLLDLPWGEDDPGHWRRAAEADGRVVLAGGLGPENVAAAIERCARGRSTPPLPSRPRRGSRTMRRSAPTSRRHAHDRPRGDLSARTVAATSRRR